jgi:hypothetical protein
MTGYIVLGVFIFYVVSVFIAFLSGYTKGRRKEQDEQKDAALRKAESDRAFEREKENIREEVKQNAQDKKNDLPGATGTDTFNNINNSLRN